MPKPLKDLKGQTFGMLTVIERAENHPTRPGARWVCLCECGNKTTTTGDHLVSGHTTSCGKHRINTRTEVRRDENVVLRNIYGRMISRCYNKENSSYRLYGELGITVFDEWKNDSKAFYSWARENGYERGLHLVREDKTKMFCPSNCIWVDDTDIRFTSLFGGGSGPPSKYFVFDKKGKKRTGKQVAKEIGMSYKFVLKRAKLSMTYEEIDKEAKEYKKNKK